MKTTKNKCSLDSAFYRLPDCFKSFVLAPISGVNFTVDIICGSWHIRVNPGLEFHSRRALYRFNWDIINATQEKTSALAFMYICRDQGRSI